MVDQTNRERITAILGAEGAEGRMDRLIPLVYEDLRAMAHRQMARQAPGHTLDTTSLVNEAYLKLVNVEAVSERGRTYFFGAAASAMRQILVDHARRSSRAKRGGDRQRVTLQTLMSTDRLAEELIQLDEALTMLAARDPRCARVLELRYFGGMSVAETAKALEVSERTVKSDWALARAWVTRALNAED